MKSSLLVFRTFFILSLLLISAASFAQEAPDFDEYGEEAEDSQYEEADAEGPCDDPSTIGEKNRSPEEQACWRRYGQAVEAEIRRQREEGEEWVRDFDRRMRESDRRESPYSARGRR